MTVNKHKKDRKTVIIIHIEIVKKKEKTCYKKAIEKTEESRMDTPETFASLDTQDTGQKNSHKKTKNISNMDQSTNQGLNTGAREM
jgi:hypothetical protein